MPINTNQAGGLPSDFDREASSSDTVAIPGPHPELSLADFVDELMAQAQRLYDRVQDAIKAARAKNAAQEAHSAAAKSGGRRVQKVWTGGLPPWAINNQITPGGQYTGTDANPATGPIDPTNPTGEDHG